MQETPELVPDGETPQNVALVVFDDLVNQARSWGAGRNGRNSKSTLRWSGPKASVECRNHEEHVYMIR